MTLYRPVTIGGFINDSINQQLQYMRQSIQNTSYYVAKDILNLNVTYGEYAPNWLPDYVPLPPNIQKINHALGQVGVQIPGDLARSPEIIVFDEKPCEVGGWIDGGAGTGWLYLLSSTWASLIRVY